MTFYFYLLYLNYRKVKITNYMQINFINKNNKLVNIKATDKETFKNWVIYLQDRNINFTTISIKKNFIF